MSTEDHHSLRNLVDRYGFAVDTQRWDLFDEIFTPDINADYGAGAVWTDIGKFKEDFATYHDIFTGTQHVMTNFLADIGGDAACAVTYGHWLLIRRGADGGDVWKGTGWYDDGFVRTSAGWRISKRRARIINWEGNLGVMSPGGVDFSMDVTSLRAAALEGSVPLLAAISDHSRSK